MMRFDPFREIDRLTQPMWNARTSVPLDVYRKGERFIVRVDLPGIDPASLDLTVERNVLSITAERSWVPADGDEVLDRGAPAGNIHPPALPQRRLGRRQDLGPVRARCADGDGPGRRVCEEPQDRHHGGHSRGLQRPRRRKRPSSRQTSRRPPPRRLVAWASGLWPGRPAHEQILWPLTRVLCRELKRRGPEPRPGMADLRGRGFLLQPGSAPLRSFDASQVPGLVEATKRPADRPPVDDPGDGRDAERQPPRELRSRRRAPRGQPP